MVKRVVSICVLTYLVSTAVSVFAGGRGTIQGRVVDEQGVPLAGVTVVVTTEKSSIPLNATTRKKGTFAVRTPDRGLSYQVRCRHDDFAEAVAIVPPTQRDVDFVEIIMSRAAPSEPAAAPAPARPPPVPAESEDDISEQRRAAIPVFNDGVTALEAGDDAAAMVKFREAAAIDSEFPEPYRALAAIAMESEDFTAAAEAAERFLQIQPDDIEVLRTLYFAVLVLGDEERLEPAVRRLAAADPEAVDGEMMDQARQLFEENVQSLAQIVLKAILEVRPELAETQYLLGLSCNSVGDSMCAKSSFEAFLNQAPDHPDADTARSMLEYLQ